MRVAILISTSRLSSDQIFRSPLNNLGLSIVQRQVRLAVLSSTPVSSFRLPPWARSAPIWATVRNWLNEFQQTVTVALGAIVYSLQTGTGRPIMEICSFVDWRRFPCLSSHDACLISFDNSFLPGFPLKLMSPASHPLQCNRPRVPDPMLLDHVIAALVVGSGYERIANVLYLNRTIRRRMYLWAKGGTTLHRLALEQYENLIGIEFGDLVVEGCNTKVPNGSEKARRSPVDRVITQRVPGLKRSIVTNALGLPLALVSAGANRNDSPLLESTLVGLATL